MYYIIVIIQFAHKLFNVYIRICFLIFIAFSDEAAIFGRFIYEKKHLKLFLCFSEINIYAIWLSFVIIIIISSKR